ncbi:rba1 protein [Tilletiaria anomala UBC 951]|uniref:Rba1 protein n=1 Tax=Tilletiaria anomala (strain ATCC 24038 / CBS 436.72 / UBC 951) TaxID=1037660 RepID=A0A066VDQ3_TILAU|nr:rba1 protein [Tilletiaria anomala UBC 951]KDN39616.1 rba1 protein [Tilletiaria anomala UBC 951]
MSTSIGARRFDSSDPRRPELCRPYKLPNSWADGETDIFAGLLGTMLSGASMLTRMPQFAYVGFLFACAHFAHDRPLSRGKQDTGTGGPWTSLIFSFMAMVTTALPKLLGQNTISFTALKQSNASA